jgi:hypothetical protein
MTDEQLRVETRELLLEMAKAFPITWDRFTHQVNVGFSVYGWIPRSDGQRDFVLLETMILNSGEYGRSFVTSSAKYSEAISRWLGFEDHSTCRLVEELLEGV